MIIDCVTEVSAVVPHHWVPTTDPRTLDHNPVPESALVLTSPNFFWYSDALAWIDLGYNQYKPKRQYRYKALMLINRQKPHRTDLVNALGSQLDQCLWSYCEQGRYIDGDTDHNIPEWVRYVNLNWYDQCCFSLVVESLCDNYWERQPFITEKTWKPIAMQHPFMILGEKFTLRRLQQMGFETFDNLWSERYDVMHNSQQRINAIVDNLNDFQIQSWDYITQQKIQHNYHRYFDKAIIDQLIFKELIQPIEEYAAN